jgi:two-component system sensor histidine kinase UhpB
MPRRPQRHEARYEAAAQAQSLADSFHSLVARARAKSGAQVTFLFQLPEAIAIPAPVEAAASCICETAMDGALRRADARRLTVELSFRHARLIVRVADDGQGFDPGDASGLRERASLDLMGACARDAGGRLDVRSAPGAGTCISALFPLETS